MQELYAVGVRRAGWRVRGGIAVFESEIYNGYTRSNNIKTSANIQIPIYQEAIDPNSFGALLRKKRLEKGVSLDTMATIVSVKAWKLQRLEYNSIILNDIDTDAICSFLGITSK